MSSLFYIYKKNRVNSCRKIIITIVLIKNLQRIFKGNFEESSKKHNACLSKTCIDVDINSMLF